MTRFGLGYRPDKDEHGLRRYGAAVPYMVRSLAIPEATSLERFAPPVLDQGPTGSCVGHGTATGLATSYAACERPLGWTPSPRWIYTLARSLERGGQEFALEDTGARPADALQGLLEWGISPLLERASDGRRSDCDPATINEELTLFRIRTSADHHVLGPYRIDSTGDDLIADICSSLAAGWAVGFGGFVDSAYMAADGSRVIDEPPDFSDPNGGGHWQCLLGYRKRGDELLVRNSWGESWGDHGSVWVTKRWLLSTCSDVTSYTIRRSA